MGATAFSADMKTAPMSPSPMGPSHSPAWGRHWLGAPWGVERQSESYQEALADAKRYQVQGHRLRIRDGSGKVLNDHNRLLFDDAYTSEQAGRDGHQQRKLALQWGVGTALHSG